MWKTFKNSKLFIIVQNINKTYILIFSSWGPGINYIDAAIEDIINYSQMILLSDQWNVSAPLEYS